MLVSLRRRYADIITSGTQPVLLAVASGVGTRAGWMVCSGLMVAISALAWTSAFRRYRAIADTPTSKVASAAQGYVELQGRGQPLGGLPLVSPLTNLPCLWYRFRVDRRQDNKWLREGGGESDTSFILDDGSGRCAVDPEGAEMLVTRRDQWIKGERRYTQWLLIERDPIYALGRLTTLGSVDLALDARQEVKVLLADWKKDTKSLLSRFDLDADGRLDMREWELARRHAKREVAAQHHRLRAQAEAIVMRKPDDGRMYLISDLDPARLARRYRLWSWAHLTLLFVGLGVAAFAWRLLPL